MQTLRKRTSPCKYKNDRTRFLGEGVSFKAKLIGILEVNEARGDRMCQEALADLKMAIRAAGEHKQRININIAIDGLRLRDEKTGDCLYHHPVHKISFIAQDMTDSRAFGYIFGSPDTGHRFFGIKTDKAASQVVISMRDLFQVVFELKKKEIEMAKQHIEQHQLKFTSPLFSESASSATGSLSAITTTKASIEPLKIIKTSDDRKESDGAEGGVSREKVVDLLDLEIELNNIQQGINQMEKITPSDPFGPGSGSRAAADPFGDSFNPIQNKVILPPPPETTKRNRNVEKHWFDQEAELFEDVEVAGQSAPATQSNGAPVPNNMSSDLTTPSTSTSASIAPINTHSQTLPTSIAAPVVVGINNNLEEPANKFYDTSKDQFDVFTDLDPLGTGRSKPYIDKKDFFQELKNPPKKTLKDLVGGELSLLDGKVNNVYSSYSESQGSNADLLGSASGVGERAGSIPSEPSFSDPFTEDLFEKDPFAEVDFSKTVCFTPISSSDPFEKFADFGTFPQGEVRHVTTATSPPVHDSKPTPLKVSLPPEKINTEREVGSPHLSRKGSRLRYGVVEDVKIPSPKEKLGKYQESKFSKESGNESSDSAAPEPPPRYNYETSAKPPPLPPKKLGASGALNKPPPVRPTPSDYDYIENYQTTTYAAINSPPLPVPSRRIKTTTNKQSTEPEYYLQPFPLLPPPKKTGKGATTTTPDAPPQPPKVHSTTSLDITLSQLTKTGFSDLAATLNMSPTSLSKMTLQELTKCLENLSQDSWGTQNELNHKIINTSQPPQKPPFSSANQQTDNDSTFTAEFDAHFNSSNQNVCQNESLFDKYAVFRELVEQEQMQTQTQKSEEKEVVEAEPETNEREEDFEDDEEDDEFKEIINTVSTSNAQQRSIDTTEDRYAALREICIGERNPDEGEVEGEGSDKEDSIVEPSRLEEDTDLLPSHPHSESTESPTVTMKEHQSIMETTIMEEDASALEADEDEVPEEAADEDTFKETKTTVKFEESNQNEPVDNVDSFSPPEEPMALDKSATHSPANSCVIWEKFENINNPVIEKAPSIHSDGHVSPWSTESKDNDVSPTVKDVKKYKNRKPKPKKWVEDEESEEGWDSRVEPHMWSPSWRENGWSDGDSLGDESPAYIGRDRDREYHSPRRGRRRRVSPWNSREQSPWEEDDRELSEGREHWEECRWQEEPRPRARYRGQSWEEERRRAYDEMRKARKQTSWSSDIDRKSSRESLAWDEEERYPKRNYSERRYRKRDDEGHNRNKRWREREWIESNLKSNRYYRDRPHEYSWDDEYSEHGDDEGHWPQRPRSCERTRRQYPHHMPDMDFEDRRYIRSDRMTREECCDMDYRRKAQTLQSHKSRRKHNQNSPFEDDFATHFNYSKEMTRPEYAADMKPPVHPDQQKKCTFGDSKSKDYGYGRSTEEGGPGSKTSRTHQQSPFEDDFTPPDTRRCSGRSVSSDMSDPKSGDDVFFSAAKEPSPQVKTSRPDSARSKQSANSEPSPSAWANSKSQFTSTPDISITKRFNPPDEGPTHPIPLDRKHKPSEGKVKVSNLRRTDSNSSLKKSDSINIFARNRDPFDDEFFSNTHSNDKGRPTSNDPSKWADAFNAFGFDDDK